MTHKRISHAGGMTLVEILVAIVILAVAVIGTSGYRYYAALDARKAILQSTSVRVALMLCESWNGVKGSETYDPSAHFSSDITIATGTGPAEPDGFTLLGSYIIASEGVNYYATLSWKDVSSGLRALNVIMAWPLQGPTITDFDNTGKLFKLTTYTTN